MADITLEVRGSTTLYNEQLAKRELLKNAMKGRWLEVVKIYENQAWIHKEKITKSGETALHIAVSDGQDQVVIQLITAIKSRNDQNHAKEAVSVTNKQGNTALHFAASKEKEKHPIMCQVIAEVNPFLVGCRNCEGETPFFLAAFHGKKGAFLYLYEICTETYPVSYGTYSTRNDSNTTLHCAINGQHFDLAFRIAQLSPDLANHVNEEGLYPLHILATKPSAFKSGKPLGSIWHRAIYNRTFVDGLKLDEDEDNNHPKRAWAFMTDVFVPSLKNMIKNLASCTRRTNGTGDQGRPNKSDEATAIPIKGPDAYSEGCSIFSRFFKLAYSEAMWIISWSMWIISWFLYISASKFKEMLLLPFGIKGYRRRRRMEHMLRSSYHVEKKHIWAVQLMDKLLEQTELYRASETWEGEAKPEDRDLTLATNQESNPEPEDRETPILTAAKYGVIEMVERILELYPIAIYDVTSVTKKNIVLLAVENRQIHVYQLLLQKTIPRDGVFGHVDNHGNSALHLAAKLAPQRPGMIPGLQMLWEIRWYQFIKESMPPNFFPLHYKKDETPIQMFTESHRDLVRTGGKWLSSTSNSSSVVATLIASVAFATAATIPGGFHQDHGTPIHENQLAFYIFAISSLIALIFSVASVVMFFAIMSSPYEARDFSSDLPEKLLMSLMTLFLGIASMLISFCAAHFFLLQGKLKVVALVLYAVVAALVIYLTIKNSSLFLNLLRVTFSDVPERLYELDDF